MAKPILLSVLAVTRSQNFTVEWKDPLIDATGTVISAVYQDYAARLNQEDVLDWRFGSGPLSASISNLAQAATTDVNGIWGPGSNHAIASATGGNAFWYGAMGPLLYLPDAGGDAGIAGAVGAASYAPNYPTDTDLVFDFNTRWVHGVGNYNYIPYTLGFNPDLAISDGGWSSPSRPVAVARARNTQHTSAFVAFRNGLIGFAATAGSGVITGGVSATFASVQLPAGKVPTAICTTPNNEFVLVTVWDTGTEQGQLAVIAVEGNPPGDNAGTFFIGTHWLWGLPNWPYARAMKLLGYVDLPMKAPMMVDASSDLTQVGGRGYTDNNALNLGLQAERNIWFNETGSVLKQAAQTGYAVVGSRAENKVCFVNMQPLYQFYRTMYFTTSGNYTATQSAGPAANQWPHAFSFASAQIPTVVATLDIAQPTAVLAGIAHDTDPFVAWTDTPFKTRAFVAMMGGHVRAYDVSTLATPSHVGTVRVGINPCSIYHNTQQPNYGNVFYVLSRGDKRVSEINGNTLAIVSSFSDGRMVDPVYVGAAMYRQHWHHQSFGLLHIMDFDGKAVRNYVRFTRENVPGDDPNWYYGTSDTVPGKPFAFSLGEII
jgi:hypothetical protein